MKARDIKQRADAHTALVQRLKLAQTLELLERKARLFERLREFSKGDDK